VTQVYVLLHGARSPRWGGAGLTALSRMQQLRGSAIVDSSPCVQRIINAVVDASGKSKAWLRMPRTVTAAAVAGRTSVPGPVKEAYRVRGMQLYVPEMGDRVQFSEPLEMLFSGKPRALAIALRLRTALAAGGAGGSGAGGSGAGGSGAGGAGAGGAGASGGGASGSGAGAAGASGASGAGAGASVSGAGAGGAGIDAAAARKRRLDFDVVARIGRWKSDDKLRAYMDTQ
jgi:hypothetical protein